jgi:hypothetical protein
MIVWVADGLRVRYTHVQAIDLGQQVCSAPSDKRGSLRIVLVIGPGIVSSDTQVFQIWRENFRHGDGRLYRLAFSRATPCGSGQELDSNAETRQSWEAFERWELVLFGKDLLPVCTVFFIFFVLVFFLVVIITLIQVPELIINVEVKNSQCLRVKGQGIHIPIHRSSTYSLVPGVWVTRSIIVSYSGPSNPARRTAFSIKPLSRSCSSLGTSTLGTE